MYVGSGDEDCALYVGVWEEEVQNGLGAQVFTDGGKYVGEFKNGHCDGHGVLTRADGRTVTGRWREGKEQH
jgi:hypothetical protein